jgi:hypothetical protein
MEWPFETTTSLAHDHDNTWVAIRTSDGAARGLGYGRGIGSAVRFRLEAAMADYHDQREDLVAKLEILRAAFEFGTPDQPAPQSRMDE